MSIICPICQNVLSAESSVCSVCGFSNVSQTEQFAYLSDEPEVAKGDIQYGEPRLVVLGGDGTGTVYSIDSGTTTIGRSPNSDIYLNDMTVSRKHAQIEHKGADYILKDLNSFNGVWCNNQSVNLYSLNNGDIIQFGSFLLQFKLN